MSNWIDTAVFYHVYPLGFCGAPQYNTDGETVCRINKVREWIPHWKEMGVNALYIGPVFESSEHGYDTKDYYQIDKRLGDNHCFRTLCEELHQNGILAGLRRALVAWPAKDEPKRCALIDHLAGLTGMR